MRKSVSEKLKLGIVRVRLDTESSESEQNILSDRRRTNPLFYALQQGVPFSSSKIHILTKLFSSDYLICS